MVSPENVGKSHTIYKNTELADMAYSQAVVPNNIMKGFKLIYALLWS